MAAVIVAATCAVAVACSLSILGVGGVVVAVGAGSWMVGGNTLGSITAMAMMTTRAAAILPMIIPVLRLRGAMVGGSGMGGMGL